MFPNTHLITFRGVDRRYKGIMEIARGSVYDSELTFEFLRFRPRCHLFIYF